MAVSKSWSSIFVATKCVSVSLLQNIWKFTGRKFWKRSKPKEVDELLQRTRVRRMLRCDFDRVVQLEKLCYRDYHLCRFQLKRCLRKYQSLVATDHPEVLGYLIYEETEDGFDIHRLGVDPLLQRRGVAELLVDMLKTILENKGKFSIFCCTKPDDESAQEALISMGFNRIHGEAGYVLMEYDARFDHEDSISLSFLEREDYY